MLGLGLTHYIPLVAYLGFWIMCIVSLGGKPLLGFYYMIPFLPYRTLRNHLLDFPLGANMLTILILAVIIGALIHGKSLPKSKLYLIWLASGIYLYLSLWIGTALGNAPAPLWLSDATFVTWKDYMCIPLTFVAAGLVIEDRKAIRTVIIITAITLAFIDRSCLLESLSRSWAVFDEEKRDSGPLAFGSNETAAFLADFAMFFWGFLQFVKKKKYKIFGYALVAATLFALMYRFSRAGYIAALFGIFVLGILKDRKLLVCLGIFLFTWQFLMPTAVQQRVNMTETNGRLDASAQERVELWENARNSIMRSPIVGDGFGTFQLGEHVDNLKDTHNWYVKVMVETGIIGLILALALLQQMLATSYRLFRKASDPLYKGLGLGIFLATCSSMVANCFGDRWTYLEISGLLWVLIGAAVRAAELSASSPATESAVIESRNAVNPYLAYR